MNSEPLLRAHDLSLQFGGILALNEVNLIIEKGEFHGLIGPNGAGKTSLINCISGSIRPSAGELSFKGKSLVAMQAHEISALGMSRSFQHIQIFGERSVRDHILLGMNKNLTFGLLGQLMGWPSTRRLEEEARVRANDLMSMFDLTQVADRPAHQLPYGLLKRLDLARALASEPDLLLLDEPTSGMSEQEALSAIQLVKDLSRKNGISLIVIEHNMRVMMQLADRITMLHLGRVIAHGTPDAVVRDPVAIDAYLGEESDGA
jgi:branched-chain amino acid transport system ATP-binding protein